MSKVWFVTGASAGIGTAVVKAALAAGHAVVATARNVEKLRAAVGEPESDRLAFIELDVASEVQAIAAMEAAVAKFGRVDVVVNNAGYSLLGNFESLTAEQFAQQLATNFFGVTYVMRAALPIMRKQRSGHFFNISSSAGVVAYKHCSAYAASKFAQEGFSLSVAEEVEPFGIKVTLVEPGFVRTDLLAPRSAVFGDIAVEGYEAPATIKANWSGYHHKQSGDPSKLADALLALNALKSPPKQFLAGSDALESIPSALQARIDEMRAHADLSKSIDGKF
jgi:NAD(P)-dependent dehydrogenase (short-subunit alcohol dehydrogenase family)